MYCVFKTTFSTEKKLLNMRLNIYSTPTRPVANLKTALVSSLMLFVTATTLMANPRLHSDVDSIKIEPSVQAKSSFIYDNPVFTCITENGSFESGQAPWDVTAGSGSVGTGYAVDGTYNFFLQYTGGAYAQVEQRVDYIVPGASYTLSYSAGTHQPSFSHYMRFEFYNASGGFISGTNSGEINFDVDNAPGLQAYSLSATAPAGTSYLKVIGRATGDYLKLDGVCLIGPQACTGSITGLVFENIVGGADLSFTNGGTYALKNLIDKYLIAANVSGNVESVVFTVSGAQSSSNTENTAPYNYPPTSTTPWTPSDGTYTINVKAYSQDGGTGILCDEKTYTFTVDGCNKTTYTVTQPTCANPKGTLNVANFSNVPNVEVSISANNDCNNSSATWNTVAYNASNYTAQVTNLSPGTYCFCVTGYDAAGNVICDYSRSFTINSAPAGPSVSVSATNSTICSGSSTTLTATATGGSGYTYSWSTGATTSSITVSPTSNTTYTVTVTSGACSTTASRAITVNPKPVLECEARVNGTWQTLPTCAVAVCPGNDLMLSVNPQVSTVTWTGPGGFTASGNDALITTSYTAAKAGNYVATLTDANGCVNTATITVSTSSGPTLQARWNISHGPWTIGNSISVCKGTKIVFSGNPTPVGGTYAWSGPAGFSSTDAEPFIVNIQPAQAGTYTLVYTKDGCSSTISFTVVVGEVIANAGADATNCLGSSINLTGSATGGFPPYTYLWSTGATTATTSVSPTVATTYTLTVTDSKGCVGSDAVIVTVNPKPTADAGADKQICTGSSVSITGSASGGTAPYTYL